MKAILLYFLLLKATISTFSGLASLPILREDLVVRHQLITDQQLDTAIVITRTTPGPVGLYVVSVGYFVDGVPGAIAGWLAMVTPALLIIPLLRYFGGKAEHPRAKNVVRAVVLSSAGLLWSATIPIGQDIIHDPWTICILMVTVAVLLTRKVDSLWVILAAALANLTAASFHLVSGLNGV